MKFYRQYLAVLLTAVICFTACSEENKLAPDTGSEQDEITLQAMLPSVLDCHKINPNNNAFWGADDQPLLLQIAEDQSFLQQYPSSFQQASQGGPASYSYIFPAEKIEHRYWCSTSSRLDEGEQNDVLEQWKLKIPSVQYPSADAIDPQGDIMVSNLTFSLPQTYVAENGLKFKLQRLNAVAAIELVGIPEDFLLQEMTFSTNRQIAGIQTYDVLNSSFNLNGDRTEDQVTVKFDAKTGVTGSDGKRKVWISMWPQSLDNYNVILKAADPQNEIHEFIGKHDVLSPIVMLDAQCTTSWSIQLVDNKSKPVLPATPEGPEDVLHGQQGETLELFKKIKAYQDNGISMVEDWWTHRLGYEGVTIHEAKLIQYNTPVHLWVLEADPAKVSFALGTPYDSNLVPPSELQTVSGQAGEAVKAGKKVIAAINGDAWGARGGFNTYGMMFKDGLCIKKWAVAPNDIANTDTFWADEQGNVGISNQETFNKVLAGSNIETAIGGWYRLISQGGEPYAQPGAKDGDPLLRDKAKTSGGLRNFLDLQPRTFIGVSEDRVYLVVADGRQIGWSAGFTLNGCARILYSLGCKRGINMDGGGSSVMIKKSGKAFKVLNRPSDDAERKVANSLLVVAR